RKIGDRENRLEDRLQALVAAPALGLVDHQELIVRGLLDLDQVRHLRDFTNGPKGLAHLAAAVERGSHVPASSRFQRFRQKWLPLLRFGNALLLTHVSEAAVQKTDNQPSVL